MREKSIQDINSDLSSIATKHDLSGEMIDLAKDLCAYAIKIRQDTAATLGIESNPDLAVKTNSKIKLALDSCYSIPRGQNCILYLNLRRTSDKSLPKFTKIHSYQKYKLYLLDEIEKGTIGSTTTVRAIISTNIYQDKLPAQLLTASHIMRWPDQKEVCETCELRDASGNPVSMTTSMLEHVDESKPLVLTDYNYSLRVMFRDKLYTGTDIYTMTSFPYCEYTPAYISNYNDNVIKEADMTDGFTRGIVIKGFLINSIQIAPAVLREDITDIAYTCKYNLATLSRIRSVADVARVFQDHFKYMVQTCYVNCDNINHIVGIYYVLKENASRDISAIEWNLFKAHNIIKYIPASFERYKCNKRSFTISVVVNVSEEIDKTPIVEYLESLNYSMNCKIRVSEIMTKIAKMDSKVNYSEVVIYDQDSDDIDMVSDMTITDDNYLYFDEISVTIES